ncbi:hypothetical protein NC652_004341 [Populus alba x Populus x berolinensis]|nr:hypothetical protein NC652_004341 [Populus alba x Populus x berolinensis]
MILVMMDQMISLAMESEKHAKQVIWLQLFVCSPFPCSFNGMVFVLHVCIRYVINMVTSTLGDFTEIHVFELLWCCEYVSDWWK